MSSAEPYSPTVVEGGKWLLAPLQGLPFDEMVKNGTKACAIIAKLRAALIIP
jgi:hypothetical protein